MQSSSVHAWGYPKDALIDELGLTITGEPEYSAGPWPKGVVLCFRTSGDVIYCKKELVCS